jgi:uncharacterized protein
METEGRTRLRVRVVPGANRPGIAGRYGDAWKIRVAAPPERGAANGALIRLLASLLRIDERSVRLVSGQASRDKIVELTGLGPGEIEARLASADGKE